MLKLENVGKIYSTANNLSVGIRKVNLELKLNEFVAITGESGSGKSTLLNVLSGIDNYEEGEMLVSGEETSYFNQEELEDYRNRYVGFIFQNYNIIDSYTVFENVKAALLFASDDEEYRNKRALELIERVGLLDRKDIKASKLSGGEKQRVVIARAIAKDPLILAADEPTGNLDSETSKEIIDLIHDVSKDKLVLIVTHDFEEVKDYATRLIRVYDSEIIEDRILKESERKDLPNLFDKEYDKLKVKDSIRFSLKDLFSTPKRMVFQSLVLLIFSLFALLMVGVYANLSSDYRSSYSEIFYNVDPRRVVINKRNQETFTESELNDLKNNRYVESVVTYDYLLDNYFSIYIDNEETFLYLSGPILPSSMLKASSLVCGRLPKNDNEMVISVTNEYLSKQDGLNTFEKFLQEVKYDDYFYDKDYETRTMQVVGVIDQTGYQDQPAYIYVPDNLYEQTRKQVYTRNCLSISYDYMIDENTKNVAYFDRRSIHPLEGLSDDEVYAYYDQGYLDVSNFCIKDSYGVVYEINDFSFKDSIQADYYYDFYVSPNVYEQIVNNGSKQVSVLLKNSNDVKKFKQTISSDYRAISPILDTTSDDMIDSALKILYLTLIVYVLLCSFFLVFVILLHSMKSRRDDVQILRTIGAKKKDVRRMFFIEFLFMGLVSFVVVTIAYLVLLFVSKGNFKVCLKAITFINFFSLLAIILLVTTLLSLWYSKIVYRNSVKKSMDER